MAIRLPDFTDERVLDMTLCGRLANAKRSSKLATNEDMVANFRRSGEQLYVMLTADGSDDRHLHVDVGRKAVLSKDIKRTNAPKDVTDVLSKFVGESIHVISNASFIVDLDDLPEDGIVRGIHGAQSSVGAASLTMFGCQLAVRGGPVERISWSISPDETKVFVTLRSVRETPIDDEYLTHSLSLMVDAFDVMIAGRTHDE